MAGNLTGLSPNNPRDYVGPNVYISTVVNRNRRPTGADFRQPETGKLYPLSSYWLVGKNPTTGVEGELWYLSKIIANVAFWIMLGDTTGPLLNITVPLGVSPIEPDGGGTVHFTSNLGTIAITGSAASPNNNFINFDLVGGGLAVDQVAVQAATPPGVNPVSPTALGLIIVNGAVVAAHSAPLESHSRALNTFNLEVQQASAVVASDPTQSGVAHFDSTQFTVDANGFVALAGGGLAIDSIAVQTGTSPIVPTAAGLVTINGTVVAAGTNPFRSNGTGPNTMSMDIQISQALAAPDATRLGISNFDSADFSVDADGFVTLGGSGAGQTISGDSGGNLSPTGGNWDIFGRSGSKTSGSVSTLTVHSPPFSQIGVAGTGLLNTGEFVTATVSRTLPATGGLIDGDLMIYCCTSANILTITANLGQTIRLGTSVTAVAGTCTSTGIGDSITLRFNATGTYWHAVSAVGVWVLV